jgi:hypothetical protein
MVRAFLANNRSDWQSSEAVPHRETLLAKLYTEGIFPTFSLKEAVKVIFTQWKCYADWKNLLETENITVPPQPVEAELKSHQKQKLSGMRKNSLCFTVAGQRAILKGLASTFITGRSQSKATLEGLLQKLNVLYDAGVFGRKSTKDSPNIFQSILFDQAGRMIWATPSVDLAGKIIAVSLGAKLERKSIEAEFNGMTGLGRELVQAHWTRCEALFPPIEPVLSPSS